MIYGEISRAGTAIAWYDDILERSREYPQKLRAMCELGVKFQDRKFLSSDAKSNVKALNKCRKYAEDFDYIRNSEKNSLILTGDVGTGKTHLAASITNHLIDKRHIPVFFQNVPAMFDRIRDEFGEKDFTKQTARSAPLLVLDDLGKEKRTEWTDQVLYEIVNARYERRMPIVITTNIKSTELANRLDKAVASRLMEMSNFVIMEGDDRRQC